MSIQEKQNRPESIAKLAAQRQLYGSAKRTRYLALALIVVVSILGIIASFVDSQRIQQYIPLVALISWFIDEQVLKRRERSLKLEAATIQEDFDCLVLCLPWPGYKGLQHPAKERVRQLANKAKRKSDGLEEFRDWYSSDGTSEDSIHSKISCQSENVWWDANLRRKWTFFLTVVFWIIVILTIGLAIMTGLTVAKLVAIIASNVRVLAWGLTEFEEQNETIQRIEGIHRHLSNLSNRNNLSLGDIRSVQDEIFEHRRTGPLVPDFFYSWNRDDQESEAAGH